MGRTRCLLVLDVSCLQLLFSLVSAHSLLTSGLQDVFFFHASTPNTGRIPWPVLHTPTVSLGVRASASYSLGLPRCVAPHNCNKVLGTTPCIPLAQIGPSRAKLCELCQLQLTRTHVLTLSSSRCFFLQGCTVVAAAPSRSPWISDGEAGKVVAQKIDYC